MPRIAPSGSGEHRLGIRRAKRSCNLFGQCGRDFKGAEGNPSKLTGMSQVHLLILSPGEAPRPGMQASSSCVCQSPFSLRLPSF